MRYVWIMFGTASAVALPAEGFPVTWEFAGEISSVYDVGNSFGGAVSPGAPFFGSYTFESTTPGDGFYRDAITDVSGQVGSLKFFGQVGMASSISVEDDATHDGADRYSVVVEVQLNDTNVNLVLALHDISGTMFSTNSLPMSPPPLHGLDWSFAKFNEITPFEGFSASGELTTLVPEPGSLLLLGIGLIGLGRRRPRL